MGLEIWINKMIIDLKLFDFANRLIENIIHECILSPKPTPHEIAMFLNTFQLFARSTSFIYLYILPVLLCNETTAHMNRYKKNQLSNRYTGSFRYELLKRSELFCIRATTHSILTEISQTPFRMHSHNILKFQINQ